MYATYFNHFFIWSVIEFEWTQIIKIVMPLTIIIFGIDTSVNQIYVFYYSVTMIGCCFTAVLLYQQSYIIFRNQTAYERNKATRYYDGKLMTNVKDALGIRWYLVWISPFLSSPMPHDGTEWYANQEQNKSK